MKKVYTPFRECYHRPQQVRALGHNVQVAKKLLHEGTDVRQNGIIMGTIHTAQKVNHTFNPLAPIIAMHKKLWNMPIRGRGMYGMYRFFRWH